MAKQITGLDKVIANLNKEIQNIEERSMKGLIEAEIIVRRDMENTPPLVPVDTGNLRGSWASSGLRLPSGPIRIMGFTANYALWAHENMQRPKYENPSRPGSGPKFLEASLKRNHEKILNVIGTSAKIK